MAKAKMQTARRTTSTANRSRLAHWPYKTNSSLLQEGVSNGEESKAVEGAKIVKDGMSEGAIEGTIETSFEGALEGDSLGGVKIVKDGMREGATDGTIEGALEGDMLGFSRKQRPSAVTPLDPEPSYRPRSQEKQSAAPYSSW